MSKKKKASGGKASKKAASSRKAPVKKAKKLKQPALPGTEGVRIKSLDSICEEIGDGRDVGNRLKREEKGLVNRALKIMADRSKGNPMAYRHANVELSLVPGDMKLRVRTLKDGDANTDAGAQFEEALGDAEETGSGQDAGEIAEALTPDDERLQESDDTEA